MTAFAASVKNACGVMPSNPLLTALAAQDQPQRFFFSVGGSLTLNLYGPGLVLSVNGGSPVTLDTNVPFTFPVLFTNGASYDVEVMTQPPGQVCTLTSNTGTIASANVTNVSGGCNPVAQPDDLAFTVSGLTGTGMVVTDGFRTVSAINGTQPFPTGLVAGSAYTISVLTQPSNPDADLHGRLPTAQARSRARASTARRRSAAAAGRRQPRSM